MGGLAAPGSQRARLRGAVAGSIAGLATAQTPGSAENGHNWAAGTLGGVVGSFAGQLAVPLPPYAPTSSILFGALKGGFAGMVGGYLQDFTEAMLNRYNTCPVPLACAAP